MTPFRSLAIVILLIICSSCGTGSPFIHPSEEMTVTDTLHGAIDDLIRKIPADYGIDRNRPLIVSSLVDIDTLSSSRLGRTLAEQIATRLVDNHFAVTELKLREQLYIRSREGELLLSRELPEISRRHAAQAVVVGTYSVGSRFLYLTIRLIDAATGRILSSRDLTLPMDREIRTLLSAGKDQWPSKH